MKNNFLIIFAIWCALFAASKSVQTPVIYIPGLMSSNIEATLDKPTVADKRCVNKTDGYVLLWPNMDYVCPVTCFAENMKLNYNATSRTTYNNPGITTRVPAFDEQLPRYTPLPGGTQNAEYKGPLMDALEENGYKRGLSLIVAPYDWRKAIHEQDEYFKNLTEMVVNTYKKNNNTPVTLLVHSMGGPMALSFLHKQTQEFKDTYIRSFITLSGAFGGSFLALSAFARGLFSLLEPMKGELEEQKECKALEMKLDFLCNSMNPNVRYLGNSIPSLYLLFPSLTAWNETEVLIQKPDKNYSLGNIHELFIDHNKLMEYEMYLDSLRYSLNFRAPGVKVHCLYGQKVPTMSNVIYEKGIFNLLKVRNIYGDGDGTVNINSLETCLLWKYQQKQHFENKGFDNINHMGMVTDEKVIKHVLNILQLE